MYTLWHARCMHHLLRVSMSMSHVALDECLAIYVTESVTESVPALVADV